MSETTTTTTSVWKREEQWVARVVGFSSQYNDSTWSANQVIGPPKVYPRHGDIIGAWAQGNRANNEFLIVEFERSVYPEQIDIYETFNPGAVVKVAVRNSRAVASSVDHELFVPAQDNNAGWETVWETATPHVEARSRIFSIPCRNLLGREINQIRLDVNCTAANNWCEIDSIKLTGHTSMNDTSYKELVAALKHLFTDQCLSDVVFELDDGEKLSSYRNVLRNRSIYFHQLFQDEATKRSETIRIPKISSRAFYQILHFVFTDQIEPVLTFEICLELMRKADEYFLGAIYDQAFEILKKSITKQNVLKIFTQTGLFAAPDDDEQILLPDVIDACVDFIQKNRRDVFLSEYIEQLSKEMLLQLIKLVQ